jgi:ABC-type phosphate transport system substrate-binding protein
MTSSNPKRATIIGLVLSLWCGPSQADVVVVVSIKSTATILSSNQVADIFLGKTGSLANGQPMVPIDQPEGSSAREEFYSRFSGKSAAQLKAYWSKIIFTGRGRPPQEVASSAEVKKKIIENSNSIGYIEQNLVDGSVRVLRVQ